MGIDKQRIIIFDILKVLAIIFVILQHLYQFTEIGSSILFPLVINQAVPIFLLISAFLYAKHKGSRTLKECYDVRDILYKFLYFGIPSLIVYILYCLKQIITNRTFISALALIKIFIMGNYGLGSYYFGILIQFYLFMPLILFLVKKYKWGGVGSCFLIGLCGEIIFNIFPETVSYYRILFVRYIFMCAVSCYFSLNEAKKPLILLVLMFIVGVFYLIAPYIFKGVSFFFVLWRNTNTIASLYIIPVFYILLKLIKDFKLKRVSKSLTALSSSTYMIMCVQMIFFWFNAAKLVGDNPMVLGFVSVLFCLTIGTLLNVLYLIFDAKVLRKVLKQ